MNKYTIEWKAGQNVLNGNLEYDFVPTGLTGTMEVEASNGTAASVSLESILCAIFGWYNFSGEIIDWKKGEE